MLLGESHSFRLLGKSIRVLANLSQAADVFVVKFTAKYEAA